MGFGSPWKLSKAVFCISAELCTDPVPMQTDEGEILEEGSPKVSEHVLCCEAGLGVAFEGTSDSQHTLLGQEHVKCSVEHSAVSCFLPSS